MEKYDVVICGGGISGSMAAVSAGRLGARVLLIEAQGYLGGMLTAGGVGPMMTFHGGDVQLIEGLMGELADRLRDRGFSPGHIFDSTGYTYTVTPFDREGLKLILDEMTAEAGVNVLFHTLLADVKVREGNISELVLCNKAGLTTCKGVVFIDATGDADLAVKAGVPFTKGREEDGLCQPMTMNLLMYNVDSEKIRNFVKESDEKRLNEEFPELSGRQSHLTLDRAPRLSMPGFTRSFKEAKQRGEITFEREGLLFFETNNPGEFILNTSRILGLDPTDPVDLSQAERLGRQQAQEIVSFVKNHIPGFEKAILSSTGPCIGVRSSRQIVGTYILTQEDLKKTVFFDDAIACYGYPIDVHGPKGQDSEHYFLEYGAYYTIPYGSLINNTIHNLITVGRCISSTFEAQASYRTTPGAGAIGHAGGAAAYLSTQKGGNAHNIDRRELQDLLRAQKAFLPE
jgi:hypothetical protein